jgi:hypothetical protein
MGDLARGVERWPRSVWREAVRLAAEVEGTQTMAAGLRLLPAGAELAQDLALPPTDQLTWEILHRDARPRGTFHLRAWTEARGIRQRARVLRRALLPTADWIKWECPWAAQGRVRLILAYGGHLLRAPVWAAR